MLAGVADGQQPVRVAAVGWPEVVVQAAQVAELARGVEEIEAGGVSSKDVVAFGGVQVFAEEGR